MEYKCLKYIECMYCGDSVCESIGEGTHIHCVFLCNNCFEELNIPLLWHKSTNEYKLEFDCECDDDSHMVHELTNDIKIKIIKQI